MIQTGTKKSCHRDRMVYQKKSSNNLFSLTESERFYTPYHNYNTRLTARLSRTSQHLPQVLDFRRSSGNQNEDTYLLDNFENSSDRFSVATSNCFDSSERFLESEDNNCCDEYIKKSLEKFKKPMDFIEPPCGNNDRQKQILEWVKNGCIAFFAVVLAWYVNHVRLQIVQIRADIESANGRINDIIDAKLDTMYQLSEISTAIKELKQSQANYRITIHRIIENEINKMYNDKTGRTDFALESAGGRIVRLSSGTENYGEQKSYLGISFCEGMHGPRAMIQTGTSPGECWAFKGSSGGAIVKLLGPIKIDAVSMEHISKDISPTGDSRTAPKDFTVWGLKTLTETGVLLGQFSYQMNGTLVQMFPLGIHVPEPYEFVELKILSNHGNTDFTCVYRFRVHGILTK